MKHRYWKLYALLLLLACSPVLGGVLGQSFTYPGGPYFCRKGGDAQHKIVTPSITLPNSVSTTGFSWIRINGTPQSQSIDVSPVTGIIDLTGSKSGQYMVTADLSDNTTISTNVRIYPENSTEFSFPNSPYCRNLVFTVPSPPNQLGGMFSGDNFTNLLSTTQGTVDLLNSYVNNSQQHNITYHLSNYCKDHVETIEILDFDPSFSLSNSDVCKANGTGQIRTTGVGLRGTFFISGPNSFTGSVNITNTGSNQPNNPVILVNSIPSPGLYTVTFTSNSNQYPCTVTHTETISIGGVDTFNTDYDTISFCELTDDIEYPNQALPSSCNGCIVRWYSDTGLVLDSITGAIDVDASIDSTYIITAKIQNGLCFDYIEVDTITIEQVKQPSLAFDPIYCKNSSPDPVWGGAPDPPGGTVSSLNGGLTTTNDSILAISQLSDQFGDRTFQLVYTPPVGTCAIPDTQSVTIRQFDGQLNYSDYSLCQASPSPQLTAYQYGNWDSITYFCDNCGGNGPFLSIDSNSGIIDPALSDADTFHVAMELKNGVCQDTFYAPFPISIDTTPDPFFDLIDQTCHLNDTVNLNPTSSGGQWTYTVKTAYSANSSLMIDSNTDQIYIGQSYPGEYEVTYNFFNTPSDCPVDTSFEITIDSFFQGEFEYRKDIYCTTTPDQLTPTIHDGIGYFWSTPLEGVDSTSGEIIITAVTGTYQVFYIADTTIYKCTIPAIDTIQIKDGNKTTFHYGQDEYCNSEQIAIVNTDSLETLNGVQGTFYVPQGSPLVIDPDSGTITLNDTLSGTFQVIYDIPGSGWCPDSQIATIKIIQQDTTTNFGYDNYTFCQEDRILEPNWDTLSDRSGDFFPTAGIGWANNPPDGKIDLNSELTGTHTFGYTWGGICKDTILHTVTIHPYDNVSLDYGVDSLCSIFQLTPTAYPDSGLFNVVQGSFQNFDPLTGEITPSQDFTQRLEITYTAGDRCPNTDTSTLFVRLPSGEIDSSWIESDAVCDSAIILIQPDLDKVYYFVNDIFQGNNYESLEYQSNTYENRIHLVQDSGNVCQRYHDTLVLAHPYPTAFMNYETLNLAAGAEIDLQVWSDVDSTHLEYHIELEPGSPISVETAFDSLPIFFVPDRIDFPIEVTTLDEYSLGNIKLFIIPSSNGCIGDSAELVLDINPGTEPIFIPEVITPNGDGNNDSWKFWVASDKEIKGYSIDLYNDSWGRVETIPHYKLNETGVSLDHLPEGVYWWLLKDPEGKVEQSGGLTIRSRWGDK